MNKLFTFAGAALLAFSTMGNAAYAAKEDTTAIQDPNRAMLKPEERGAKKHEKIATDAQSRQRGAEVVLGTCMTCHSLKYIKYRDLESIGFTKEKAAELRGDKGRFDPLIGQMPEDAALASFGVVPPDLSLMAAARHGRERYIPEFLTSFYVNDKGESDNHMLRGTKMPDILGWASADAAQREEIENKSRDVAAFLMWAADPKADERYALGRYVLGYLVLLIVLLFFLKKKVWRNVKHHHDPLESVEVRI